MHVNVNPTSSSSSYVLRELEPKPEPVPEPVPRLVPDPLEETPGLRLGLGLVQEGEPTNLPSGPPNTTFRRISTDAPSVKSGLAHCLQLSILVTGSALSPLTTLGGDGSQRYSVRWCGLSAGLPAISKVTRCRALPLGTRVANEAGVGMGMAKKSRTRQRSAGNGRPVSGS